MGTTPISGLRYAELTDPANAKTLSQNLATDLDTLVNARFASSVARDAAIPSPVDGQHVYRTDLHGDEYWRNAEWRAAGSIVFAEATLGAPAATITLSGIPANARHLTFVLTGRCTQAGNSLSSFSMQYNQIATGYYQFLQDSRTDVSSGNATSTAFSIGLTSFNIGNLPQASASVQCVGSCVVQIPFYTRAIDHQCYTRADAESSGISNIFRVIQAGNDNGTSNVAINRLDVLPSSGNFDTGTTYGLYGSM